MKRRNRPDKDMQEIVGGAMLLSALIAAALFCIRELLIYIEIINP